MWKVIMTFAAAVLVIYLSYLFSRYIGKSVNGRGGSRYMRIIDQIAVGQDRNMAIVQVGNKYLLVGITAGKIHLLTELADDDLLLLSPENEQEDGKTLDFKEVMSRFGDFTKKGR